MLRWDFPECNAVTAVRGNREARQWQTVHYSIRNFPFFQASPSATQRSAFTFTHFSFVSCLLLIDLIVTRSRSRYQSAFSFHTFLEWSFPVIDIIDSEIVPQSLVVYGKYKTHLIIVIFNADSLFLFIYLNMARDSLQ